MSLKNKPQKQNSEITNIFKWSPKSIKNLRSNLKLSRAKFGKKVGVQEEQCLDGKMGK